MRWFQNVQPFSQTFYVGGVVSTQQEYLPAFEELGRDDPAYNN
jgi:hypothetical protein